MLIYFAGPLFSKAEVDFNQNLTDKLEAEGFEVFLPQRDGVEKDREPYLSMSEDERRVAIFAIDKDNVLKADCLLFVLDGRVPDEGAAFELGVAYAHKILTSPSKKLVGLMTDKRAAFPGWKLNPMISVPLEFIAENEEELLNYLKSINK